jgi:peptidoglycan hydrolase-like protein with peptidoglycan-binding domain
MGTLVRLPLVNMMGADPHPSMAWQIPVRSGSAARGHGMKRTLFALGLSTVLALPVLVNGQMTPTPPGPGSGPGAGGSGSGARMEQEDRRGQTDFQSGEIRQVQERLKEAGFNPGPADGQLGPQTKDALKGYQKAQGLPQTGQLDEPTKDLLMAEKPKNAPGRMQSPRESTREEVGPAGSMPGGRLPNEPGTGSRLPGGSSPGR